MLYHDCSKLDSSSSYTTISSEKMGKNDKKGADKGGKAKGGDKGKDAKDSGSGGKAKGAQSINVRHILVSLSRSTAPTPPLQR